MGQTHGTQQRGNMGQRSFDYQYSEPTGYSSIGTEGSKGTKIFSLVGKIKKHWTYRSSDGHYAIRDHLRHGRRYYQRPQVKAVQTGGPSGGCIPESLLDIPVDFDKLYEVGSMMGSGGMIVMDDKSCMVDVARYFLAFLKEESCGKCVPCREGVRRMSDILEDICAGKGTEGDINLLEAMSSGNYRRLPLCAGWKRS